MKKISGSTFYSKKLFPILGGGFLIFFFIISLSPGVPIIFLIVPIIMAIVGYKVVSKIILNMADEVYDIGDELIFHKGKKVQHVKLQDIINIEHIYMSAPVRVVVHVKKEGPIGKELVFLLPNRLSTIKSPYVQELIERVDKAKNSKSS